MVVVVVAVWLFVRESGDGSSTATDTAVATTTAQVEGRDLVETDSVEGTLGYAGSRNVIYTGPGVAAKSSSTTTTNTAYSSSESETLAVAYRQTALSDPTGDGAPTTEGSTDPAATTDSSGETSTGETTTEPTETTTEPAPTETSPAETTPTETAPTGTTPTESTPTETTPTEPATQLPETSGSNDGASEVTGSQTGSTPSSSAGSEAASASGGTGTPQAGTGEGAAASSASSGSESATITWLPDEGNVVERGEAVFRANGKATLLLYGETPAWRTLSKGVKGEDVRQLEQNLVAMGYGKKTITVDTRFGGATKRAVKGWQRDLGVDDTGVVKLGMVTFLPGKRRVESIDVALGDQIQVGQTVLTTTTTRQVVTVDLDASDQELLAVDDAVTIELPDGSNIEGTVDDIGTVATSSESDSSTQGAQADQGADASSSTATVPITITLDEGSGVDFDEAPVDVEIASDTAENVIAVPVTALIALLGGGYAVEVVDDSGQTHLVRVDPGMYADGYVEIEGDGIDEGTTVVVPE